MPGPYVLLYASPSPVRKVVMKFKNKKRVGRWERMAWVLAVLLLSVMASAQTGGNSAPAPVASGFTLYVPVKVEGRRIFDVTSTGALSATDRADMINRRLETLIAQPEDIPPFTKENLKHQGQQTLITLGDNTILSVTDSDAQAALMTQDELALLWGGKLSSAVKDARAVRSNPLRGAWILIKNSFSDLIVSLLQWLPRLAGAVVLWILFFFIARFARRIAHAITKRTRMDENVRQLIRAAAFYGTWIVGMFAIFSTTGHE